MAIKPYLGKVRPKPKPKAKAPKAAQKQVPRAPAKKPSPAKAVKKGNGAAAGLSHHALNAFSSVHVPLPRRMPDYAVSRFVNVIDISSSNTVDLVYIVAWRGANMSQVDMQAHTDIICFGYDAAVNLNASPMPYLPPGSSTATVNSNLGDNRVPLLGYTVPTTNIQRKSMRARLHALSCKITCLGTSTGLFPPGSVFLGAVPSLEMGTSAESQTDTLKQLFYQEQVAVGALREFSANRLLQGHTLHAKPAEQINYETFKELEMPALTADFASLAISNAMTPLIYYIPRVGATGTVVNYRLHIGTEWALRHPYEPLLRSSQSNHKPSDPSTFDRAVGLAQEGFEGIGIYDAARMGRTALEAVAAVAAM